MGFVAPLGGLTQLIGEKHDLPCHTKFEVPGVHEIVSNSALTGTLVSVVAALPLATPKSRRAPHGGHLSSLARRGAIESKLNHDVSSAIQHKQS